MSALIMKLQDLHPEVINQLEKLAENTATEARLQWFKQQHKGSELKSYGIKTPEVRKLIKKYTDRFEQLSLQERFDLAKLFYKSGLLEKLMCNKKPLYKFPHTFNHDN